MSSDPAHTTLGYNINPPADTGNTLATASCHVNFGYYTSLLNLAAHSSVDIEAIVRIVTDPTPMTTVFDHDGASTYYKFVHATDEAGQIESL